MLGIWSVPRREAPESEHLLQLLHQQARGSAGLASLAACGESRVTILCQARGGETEGSGAHLTSEMGDLTSAMSTSLPGRMCEGTPSAGMLVAPSVHPISHPASLYLSYQWPQTPSAHFLELL